MEIGIGFPSELDRAAAALLDRLDRYDGDARAATAARPGLPA